MSRTNDRLAHSLRIADLPALADRAATGEFSDFESPHALPKMRLVQELREHLLNPAAAKLIELVQSGHFDDTKDDSECWWQSSEGRAARRSLGIDS